MGLDMYLSAKKNVAHEQAEIVGASDAEGLKLRELVYEGMYWRKANAIHAWFVENVQGGEDDCREYDVSLDDLETLMQLCGEVIANPEKAAELLPPKSGFFFGAAEVDDWYWEQVKRTHEELKVLVSVGLGDWWSFTYQSSW